jgi:predicted nuclease with RNAse H fold
MKQRFLGVDIAGQEHTAISCLELSSNKLEVLHVQDKDVSLREIVEYCIREEVLGVSIDAPLTSSLLDNEAGFRQSDRKLREFLPNEWQNWVMSMNSMMAVPVRGRFLADILSPEVGTIIETHPRACLGLLFAESQGKNLTAYKGKEPDIDACEALLELWCKRWDIQKKGVPISNNVLDALVCATVAYLYHAAPHELTKLGASAQPDKDTKPQLGMARGHGPFVVVRP